MFADEEMLPWLHAARQAVPGLRLFDVHTHTGVNDPDLVHATVDELLDALGLVDARAAFFTLHEPGGYPAANDRVLAEADDAAGRLIPFCRLDPEQDPVGEAERCLAAGARGLKLHPRAESFTLHHPRVPEIFALAGERRLPVIVHAGRGIPALGRDALGLAERFPEARVILAHAGICDLSWIWREAPEHPNLFFDTSWWNPTDLVALFSLVPPGQILWASDTPYGTPLFGAVVLVRCALQAALEPAQIEVIAGAQAERLIAGDDPLDLGPAPAAAPALTDILLERVYSMLTTSLGRGLGGGDMAEFLGLVRLACEVGDDAPQAQICRSIVDLLDRRERFAAEHPAPSGFRPAGIHLIVAAAVVARTPRAPLPAESEPVTVGSRTDD